MCMALKRHSPRVEFQKSMEGLCFHAGSLRKPLRGSTRGRPQNDALTLEGEQLGGSTDERGFPGSRAASNDQHTIHQRATHGLSLLRREGHLLVGFKSGQILLPVSVENG